MEGIMLPPGWRFRPSDAELIIHYLQKKIDDPLFSFYIFKDVNIYDFNPDQLIETYGNKENHIHYFFSPTERKYRGGSRPNRCTSNGHWKASAADTRIEDHESNLIGYRKPLVFYIDKSSNLPNKKRAKKSVKTDWLMQEFRTKEGRKLNNANGSKQLDDWVICKIYKGNRKDSKGKEKEEEAKGEEVEATIEGQGEGVIGMEVDIVESMEGGQDNSLDQYFSNLEQGLPLDAQFPCNWNSTSDFEDLNGMNLANPSDIISSSNNMCDPDRWDYGSLFDVNGSIKEVGESSTSTNVNQNGYGYAPMCISVNANDQLSMDSDPLQHQQPFNDLSKGWEGIDTNPQVLKGVEICDQAPLAVEWPLRRSPIQHGISPDQPMLPMLPMLPPINQQPWVLKEHSSTSDQHREVKDSSRSSE